MSKKKSNRKALEDKKWDLGGKHTKVVCSESKILFVFTTGSKMERNLKDICILVMKEKMGDKRLPSKNPTGKPTLICSWTYFLFNANIL